MSLGEILFEINLFGREVVCGESRRGVDLSNDAAQEGANARLDHKC